MSLKLHQDLLNQAISALREPWAIISLPVVLYGPGRKGKLTTRADWDLLLIAENLPEKPLARHFS